MKNTLRKLTLMLFSLVIFMNIAAAENLYNESYIAFPSWFNTDEMNLNTTAGVMLYYVIFFILIAMLIFSEIYRIPAIMLIGGILSFFTGILFFATLSVIVGFIFITLSILCMIRSAVISRQ